MARRLLQTAALALAMLMFGASAAWAADCYVVKKPDGAGTHATYDASTDTATGLTPSGRMRGGFIDVYFGDELFLNDIMIVSLHTLFANQTAVANTSASGLANGGLHSPAGKGVDLYHPPGH